MQNYYVVNFNPIAFQILGWPIHWYGIMYLLGFAGAWALLSYRLRTRQQLMSQQDLSDFIFYAALGVIVGGRVGYMLFYNWFAMYQHPLLVLQPWKGGMSFHGGLIGVLIAMGFFARKIKQPFLVLTDFIAPAVPIGLAAGRLGNFINGELWGRVTDVPWAMIFPQADWLPRHPSQLYEFGLEGILLFAILWCYSSKPRPTGAVAGVFAIAYGIFRSIAECFREPDVQIGYIQGWLTEGQLLSIPLILIGILLLLRAYRLERKV